MIFLIDGIHIFNNLKMANCDGIDPDHCKNLIIRNTYIEAADDGIHEVEGLRCP